MQEGLPKSTLSVGIKIIPCPIQPVANGRAYYAESYVIGARNSLLEQRWCDLVNEIAA